MMQAVTTTARQSAAGAAQEGDHNDEGTVHTSLHPAPSLFSQTAEIEQVQQDPDGAPLGMPHVAVNEIFMEECSDITQPAEDVGYVSHRVKSVCKHICSGYTERGWLFGWDW
jgi:hypothetical protein